MGTDKIASLRGWIPVVEGAKAEVLVELHGARLNFSSGAHVMRLAGITGTSTMSYDDARKSWLRAARRKIAQAEQEAAQ